MGRGRRRGLCKQADRRMSVMPELSEWVELAFGYDKDSVRVIAQAELARLGLSPDELTAEEIRLDIGRDAESKDFYRVRVRRSLLERSGWST
jgi:hypothetical protein